MPGSTDFPNPTITEALAEVKTIGKRLEKKRQTVMAYLVRQELLKDPMEKEGGSAEFIRKERQGIKDLEDRIVTLRRAIAFANAATLITINGVTRTLQDWLTWRREVAPQQVQFLSQIRARLDQARREASTKGLNIVAAAAAVSGDVKQTDILVFVSEAELAKEIEDMETVVGQLDGQLSLKNATTQI